MIAVYHSNNDALYKSVGNERTWHAFVKSVGFKGHMERKRDRQVQEEWGLHAKTTNSSDNGPLHNWLLKKKDISLHEGQSNMLERTQEKVFTSL